MEQILSIDRIFDEVIIHQSNVAAISISGNNLPTNHRATVNLGLFLGLFLIGNL
jgi:hypothetical protein